MKQKAFLTEARRKRRKPKMIIEGADISEEAWKWD
jgi:hypothetical protein